MISCSSHKEADTGPAAGLMPFYDLFSSPYISPGISFILFRMLGDTANLLVLAHMDVLLKKLGNLCNLNRVQVPFHHISKEQ